MKTKIAPWQWIAALVVSVQLLTLVYFSTFVTPLLTDIVVHKAVSVTQGNTRKTVIPEINGANQCEPVPTFRNRQDFAQILQRENHKIGVELGVQSGKFMQLILNVWKSAEAYDLVDLWAQQENYKDAANVENDEQEKLYQATLAKTKAFPNTKFTVCRNFTNVCVHNYPDNHFDFIYVDARHDRKGVFDDLTDWWPKLKVGGIMAGHDYVTQKEVGTDQDWTKNYDGTIDETGDVVLGAVNEFFVEKRKIQLQISYRDQNFNNWAVHLLL